MPDQRPDRTARPNRPPRVERCVALVDARFWWWLLDHPQDGPIGIPPHLGAELERLLRRPEGVTPISRIVWFTDENPPPRHQPGVVVRQVPAIAHDGGVAMLRGMAQEMAEIGQRGSAERLLLVSDDERLILAVDDAQRAGLAVDMVIDEAARDAVRLRDEDPQWARLLLLADRQLVLGSDGTTPTRTGGVSRERQAGFHADAAPREPRPAPSAEAMTLIDEEIRGWWDDEAPDQRAHWRREIQTMRGIPQDLDRELLQRISRRMGQALSPGEKNAMRALARQRIEAETAAEPPAEAPLAAEA